MKALLIVGLFIPWWTFAVTPSTPPKGIPAPLLPWVPWVLHGLEETQCPPAFDDVASRTCHFPSVLDLEVSRSGALFRQQWSLFRDAWVPLPGGEGRWPLDIRTEGKSAIVVRKNGSPHLYLQRGSHTVSGRFQWDAPPESLPIPPQSGLVQLKWNGRAVPFPNVDSSGKVWLQASGPAEASEGNHLELKVYRLVTDEIPLQLETRIQIQVSGEARSLDLGPVLPPRFQPMALTSDLPAALQPSGILRVQLRPGTWTLSLTARHEGPAQELAPRAPTATWVPEEIWAFSARNHLRTVALEGPPSLDPSQTSLPAEWQSFPAFLMTPEQPLKLVEKRRGDDDPTGDRLSLNRVLWLDFDGKGYAVSDRVTGELKRAWRLDVRTPMKLNQVSVSGTPQLITRTRGDSPEGVEIREGRLDLVAEGRIEPRGTFLSTTGWYHDFQSMGARLHLPPGWRVLTVSGVDRGLGTWSSYWNLGNIFLGVLLVVALLRLAGPVWAFIGGCAVVLTFPEPHSPDFLWVAVLVALFLYRVIPEGRFRSLFNALRWGLFGALLIQALPFAITQVRQGLYPILEHPHDSAMAWHASSPRNEVTLAPTPPDAFDAEGGSMELEEKSEMTLGAQLDRAAPRGKMMAPKKGSYGSGLIPSLTNQNLGQKIARVDPNAVVQVGPGLPRWEWNTVDLRWSGPVSQGERLGIFLLPPLANRALGFLRALAVAALLLMLFRQARHTSSHPREPRLPSDQLAAFLLPLLLWAAPVSADTFPSPKLLEELKGRLTEPATCYPECAAIERVAIEYRAGELSLRLGLGAAIPTTVPLPGHAQHWLPTTVVVDGKAATGLARNGEGTLLLALPAGAHTVLLRGPLPNRDSVQVPFPMKANNVTASGSGWSLEGLSRQGQVESHVELRRTRSDTRPQGELEATNLPPFVLVERELGLGLAWTVRTRVSRLTPSENAVVMSVPLLQGESVTTPGVRVEKGRAQVNMAPRSTEFVWDSILETRETLKLTAPEADSWTEFWKLDASAIWSVKFEGIPVILHLNDEGRKLPLWRPWPGESLTLQIQRPGAVEGGSLSIEMSRLNVEPGSRALEASLDFQMRSSRGGEHTIQLPKEAELQTVKVNEKLLPARLEEGKLTLPVTPGSSQVEVKWREKGGISTRFRSPSVDLGVPSANNAIQLSLPFGRWVLWAGGPVTGPAVLIWGELIVVLLLAWLLARTGLTPLRTWQWVLLGIGLTQCRWYDQFLLVGLLLALGWRKRAAESLNDVRLNLVQMGLAALSVLAAGSLLLCLERGFFGNPEMHVAGNGSQTLRLLWYSDRLTGPLPQPWTLTLPLLAYRLAMLAWALWLAASLLRWGRWGWDCFSSGRLWWRRSKLQAGP